MGSVKSNSTQNESFLLCFDCDQRRWSVQMSTFRSYHPETWASITQWRECLDPGGANRIRKALYSNLGLLKLNLSPNLKIHGLHHLAPFRKQTNKQSTAGNSQSFPQFVRPNQCWLVHKVIGRGKRDWLGKRVYVLSDLICFLPHWMLSFEYQVQEVLASVRESRSC